MEVIDLTQLISPTMPVYPGTEGPLIREATTIETDGFAEKCLTFFSHTGTHIDAPGHVLQGRKTLDQFGPEKFLGKGLVIDVRGHGSRPIGIEDIRKPDGFPTDYGFILFNTGWDGKWGTEEYFRDFPVLSGQAAKWVCEQKLKGIGFDCISADPVGAAILENHRILLGGDLIIVENLRNLERLENVPFLFSCLPLKIGNADGSPVRAVGIVM